MGKFLLGVVLAIAIAAGLYFFLVMGAREELREEKRGTTIEVGGAVGPQKYIPPGVLMEDGTI